MRPIPKKMREQIASDPEMSKCIYNNSDCRGDIEWEHCFEYARRQVNEVWAIIGVCTYHHRGDGLDKNYNQYRALIRADMDEVISKYPKFDWIQLKKYLIQKYESK